MLNVVLGNEWIAKVNGIINYKERIFTYESDYEMNQIPISCWQKFQDPKKVYEIEPYDKNGVYELELEENENVWDDYGFKVEYLFY